MNKPATIRVRLTDERKAELQKLADAKRVKLSEYIRELLESVPQQTIVPHKNVPQQTIVPQPTVQASGKWRCKSCNKNLFTAACVCGAQRPT